MFATRAIVHQSIQHQIHGFTSIDFSFHLCRSYLLKQVVREALMQPLRICQAAKQFLPCTPPPNYVHPVMPSSSTAAAPTPSTPPAVMLTPCADYPNCPYCPMNLASQPVPKMTVSIVLGLIDIHSSNFQISHVKKKHA